MAQLRNEAAFLCLESWMLLHGSHLTSLVATGRYRYEGNGPPLKLPCQQLQQLRHLQAVGVDLQPQLCAETSQDTGAIAGTNSATALTRLTSLRLDLGHQGDLRWLSALTSLRQLMVLGHQAAADLGEVLSNLQDLTRLHFRSMPLQDPASLAHISSLQQLKELVAVDVQGASAAAFAHVPSSITLLKVGNCCDDMVQFSSSATPGLQQLTALQRLELGYGTAVDPTVLANMALLTHLELQVEDFQAGQLAGLLTILPGLQQLQDLCVEQESGAAGFGLEEASLHPQQLSALLSSSHLTRLYLFNITCLPVGAGRHLFVAGRQLTALQVLELKYGTEDDDGDPAPEEPPLSCGDLARMASCCPSLRELRIAGAVQHQSRLSDLLQASSLYSLSVVGPGVDNQMAQQLALLTQLKDLWVMHAINLTDIGICMLTRLSALTLLVLDECGCSESLHCCAQYENDQLCLVSEDSPPDVWCQLELECRKSTMCLEWMLDQEWTAAADAQQNHQQQLASLDQQLVELQAQLAESQAQLVASQGQVVTLQAQLADSQAQLAHSHAQLEGSRVHLAFTRTRLGSSQVQLADTQAELADTQAQLAAALAQMEDCRPSQVETQALQAKQDHPAVAQPGHPVNLQASAKKPATTKTQPANATSNPAVPQPHMHSSTTQQQPSNGPPSSTPQPPEAVLAAPAAAAAAAAAAVAAPNTLSQQARYQQPMSAPHGSGVPRTPYHVPQKHQQQPHHGDQLSQARRQLQQQPIPGMSAVLYQTVHRPLSSQQHMQQQTQQGYSHWQHRDTQHSSNSSYHGMTPTQQQQQQQGPYPPPPQQQQQGPCPPPPQQQQQGPYPSPPQQQQQGPYPPPPQQQLLQWQQQQQQQGPYPPPPQQQQPVCGDMLGFMLGAGNTVSW